MAMTFHHVGIPSAEQRSGEAYLEPAKLFVTDAAASPYGIEWLRFEPGSPMPEAMRMNPHVAFMVEDLDAAMAGKTVLVEPFDPMPGLRVGFVLDDGAVIEFMQKTA
jgi:hypothetical protein